MPQQAATLAARDSWRPLALLLLVVALQALRALQAQRRLLAACSDRAAAAEAEAQQVLAVQAVRAVAAQVAVVARVAAAHTQQALVVSVVLAGHWFWSFDHAAICCC